MSLAKKQESDDKRKAVSISVDKTICIVCSAKLTDEEIAKISESIGAAEYECLLCKEKKCRRCKQYTAEFYNHLGTNFYSCSNCECSYIV